MIHAERVKTLRSGIFGGKSVLYWMIREKRSSDNWSLISAQKVALKNKVPLYVCFQYLGNFPESNIRQYKFLFKGLLQLQEALNKKNITFIFLKGKASEVIPKLIYDKCIGTVITDYSPLKIYKNRQTLKRAQAER